MTARRAVSRFDPREGEPRIYSVGEIVSELRALISMEYPRVLVQGEITDWKPPGPAGHVYFKLKDSTAQIRIVIFARAAKGLGFQLENGLAIQVDGEITVFTQRGEMQLVAERISPVGSGALQAKFEALKKKLQAEGLFAEERKRKLPTYPTRIAIVTSPTGAAVHDMIRILRQRAAYAQITIAPARVQGIGAAQEIAQAIALVNEWGEADVLIVGRGGGSMEDLWAFNEEVVVRAIVASRIPVVSAVGHEVDVTLADLAADARAATPTHAAQHVVPHKDDAYQRLVNLTKHARDRLLREIQRDRNHLQGMRNHHSFHVPHQMVKEGMQALGYAREDLARMLEGWVVQRRRSVAGVDDRLHAYAPARVVARVRERLLDLARHAEHLASATIARRRADVSGGERLLASYDYRGVLRRGYALVWTEDGERLVNRGRTLHPGSPIQVQFADARARAQVTRVDATSEEETP
jgi:exodeoxyribonuclease VII large subunit